MKNATLVAPHPPLRAEDLAAATARRWSELVVLDLAMPRNVEPAARALANVLRPAFYLIGSRRFDLTASKSAAFKRGRPRETLR